MIFLLVASEAVQLGDKSFSGSNSDFRLFYWFTQLACSSLPSSTLIEIQIKYITVLIFPISAPWSDPMSHRTSEAVQLDGRAGKHIGPKQECSGKFKVKIIKIENQ